MAKNMKYQLSSHAERHWLEQHAPCSQKQLQNINKLQDVFLEFSAFERLLT